MPAAYGVSSAARETARGVGATALALAAGLAAGSLLVRALGLSPVEALSVMGETVFATRSGFTDTLLYATPLLLIALGYTLAYRARLWTVGGEGQFHASAIAVATLVFTLPPDVPRLPAFVVVIIAGAAAGALWAAIPGWLRAYRNVNEVVSTLMLNFVGIFAMHWLIRTAFRDPFVGTLQTRTFPSAFDLPALPGTRVHLGLALALILVPLLAYLAGRSTLGFRIRAIGFNPSASRATGIPVDRTVFTVFLISGVLAGLAGAVHVLGVAHRLIGDLSPGFGYTAIMVALLARSAPLGTVPAAFLLASLAVGSEGLQVEFGVPTDFVQVFAGLLVLFVLAGDALRRGRGSL
ncbi:MAG: ABC transporter permease [Armatimonadota bacterium]|nr:ABC transporter permease [Armatimonadota bacterium]